MNDEELQERIERGDQPEGKEDQAYCLVFAALRKEPAFQLPANFADRVMRRVTGADNPRREVFWFVFGLFSFVIALGVAVFLTGFTPSLGAFEFVSSYPGLFVFGALFIGALQWIDKRMIRKPTVTTP